MTNNFPETNVDCTVQCTYIVLVTVQFEINQCQKLRIAADAVKGAKGKGNVLVH